MIRLIAFIAIVLSFASPRIHAEEYTATPLQEVLSKVYSQSYVYLGKKKLHGYYSTSSCLYASDEVLVVHNYCYPKRNYPARSFTIISKNFGMIELYEEDFGSVVQRKVTIEEFPELMNEFLPNDMQDVDPEYLDSVYEKLSSLRHPGCWSTNYSLYTQGKDVDCYRYDINSIDAWANETQEFTSDKNRWNTTFKKISRMID